MSDKRTDKPRGIVAEFHKTGSRLELFSLHVLEETVSNEDGKIYTGLNRYDVDMSRAYGYVFHLSGGGGDRTIAVSGIYWTSGDVKVKEEPWRGKRTAAIRKRNRTRLLRKLPKAFDLKGGDLLQWLENNAIHDETIYCSTCRDYLPSESLCVHSWWCEKTCAYSTPDQRCKCKNECCD